MWLFYENRGSSFRGYFEPRENPGSIESGIDEEYTRFPIWPSIGRACSKGLKRWGNPATVRSDPRGGCKKGKMETFGQEDAAAASKVLPPPIHPFAWPFSSLFSWMDRTNSKKRVTERKPRYSPTTTRDGFLRSTIDRRTAQISSILSKNFYLAFIWQERFYRSA